MIRHYFAAAIGTAILLISVIGSGIMGVDLADGNDVVTLLGNALATGAMLYVITTVLGPISGAHFNPAVSLAFALRGQLSGRDLTAYVVSQVIGAMSGVWVVHLMFDVPLFQVLQTLHRTGVAQWWSELLATLGLLFVIFGGCGRGPMRCPRWSRSTSWVPIGLPRPPVLPIPL